MEAAHRPLPVECQVSVRSVAPEHVPGFPVNLPQFAEAVEGNVEVPFAVPGHGVAMHQVVVIRQRIQVFVVPDRIDGAEQVPALYHLSRAVQDGESVAPYRNMILTADGGEIKLL